MSSSTHWCISGMESNLEEINLKKNLDILVRRWPVAAAVFGSSLGLAAVGAFTQKPIFTASGDLLFEVDQTSTLLQGGNLDQVQSFNEQASPLSTQSVIIQSNPILEEAISRLELSDEDGNPLPPLVIRNNLEIEAVMGTDVMRLSYYSDNAEFAANVVNAVMQSYIENDITENRAGTKAAREFISAQLPLSEEEVNQAAEALRQFRTENNIVSIQEESTRVVNLISKLDGQIADIQSQMMDSGARVEELRKKAGFDSQRAILLSSLNNSEGIQEARRQYQTVQQQLISARNTYTDGSPQVSALQREEASLRALLQSRVVEVAGPNAGKIDLGMLQVSDLQQELAGSMAQLEANRRGLQEQLRSLMESREIYRTQASKIPSLETRQQELQRKLTAAQETYENLLSSLQEIRVTENQTIGNARIIQEATAPDKASLKKRNLLLAAGAFLGLSMGVAAALLIDILDRSLKTISDVKGMFGYTLVGLIPQYATVGGPEAEAEADGVSPRIIIANSPRSIVNESYQMLRANLKFLSSDKELQSLVITSSVPGEGKSEVSANLAAAMAQVGRRVLIVDADMRNPSQHHLWGLVNQAGLSNVIVGQEKFKNAVHNVTPRLSVLTAGVVPPNPLALLDSNRMAQLIEQFSEQYDCVIFDTPPLAGMADAAVIGKMVDGLLLVAQPGIVDGNSANAAKTILERSAPNILGIVANGVDIKHTPEGYFYTSKDAEYHDPIPKKGELAFSMSSKKHR